MAANVYLVRTTYQTPYTYEPEYSYKIRLFSTSPLAQAYLANECQRSRTTGLMDHEIEVMVVDDPNSAIEWRSWSRE